MNNDFGKNPNPPRHSIAMSGREGLSVTGVTDVISFDEENVVLKTDCGGLSVEGSGLHISVLSLEEGNVVMDGRVNLLSYFDPEPDNEKTGSFFARLFH